MPAPVPCLPHGSCPKALRDGRRANMFKLDSLREITGIQLEIYRGKWWACPFKIWVSEDGKRWMEIHEEMQERNRYRIDLRRKAKVKAKYIRIGRMEGYRNESLVIHKILIYGK